MVLFGICLVMVSYCSGLMLMSTKTAQLKGVKYEDTVNIMYICLFTSPLPLRCQALQHPGQLSRGDQAVRLWCERPAHRFHGQLLCWNALLHVGESALHACAPTPFPLALSPLSFSSFLTLLSLPGPALCLPFLLPSLTPLPRSEGRAQERALWQRARQLCSLFLVLLSPHS